MFYPDSRAYFDETVGPYIPDGDIPPIWNPEFFGNTIMVNGTTWPFLTVEQRRYRFRLLNGCDARFLILDFNQIPGAEVWQIGPYDSINKNRSAERVPDRPSSR